MRGRVALAPQMAVAALALATGAAPMAWAAADASDGARALAQPIDDAVAKRLLALDPELISAADVRDVLAHAPAPRIINVQGSFAPVTMQPFAEFLIAMGYPEAKLSDPADGKLSWPSFGDGAELAGALAWYYEHERMMPMLIGHSQGGMLVIKVLHELAGSFGDTLAVWNPATRRFEPRTSITDPWTGAQRPVIGLKVPYAAALATGRLPRIVLGQWNMLAKLREIPDTVEEFTGFSIDWDPIAGTVPGIDPYRAVGTASVRNVALSAATSHIAMPQALELGRNAATRDWIDRYRPGEATLPDVPGIDLRNIVHAADIWFSIKKHWCIEAQRYVRARQGERGAQR